MLVPFLDLKRETESCRSGIDVAIARVLASGRFILGAELEALEAEFAEYLSLPFAVGVASGTDAITLALEGSGAIRRGMADEVITSALSAAFTPLAIWRAGAVPCFADVDPETLQIDFSCLESSLSEKTKAIVPVHLFGNPCDVSCVVDLARRYGLVVIEDACQAHGSKWDGKALGTFGDAAAFSFYPTKNLGALGDGGMVVTRNEGLSLRVRRLRHGGQSSTYVHEELGCNSRLDELQAAILRLKLGNLERRNEIRRVIAERYDAAFVGLDLKVLPVAAGSVPNRHLYPIRSSRRDEMRRFLLAHGIETLVHYPTALPSQPALKRFVAADRSFPAAEQAAREIFSLPLYPELSRQEIDYVIQTVHRFFDLAR